MDYLTKPLNGIPFRIFCNSIMQLDELSVALALGRYKEAKYENAKQTKQTRFTV